MALVTSTETVTIATHAKYRRKTKLRNRRSGLRNDFRCDNVCSCVKDILSSFRMAAFFSDILTDRCPPSVNQCFRGRNKL